MKNYTLLFLIKVEAKAENEKKANQVAKSLMMKVKKCGKVTGQGRAIIASYAEVDVKKMAQAVVDTVVEKFK